MAFSPSNLPPPFPTALLAPRLAHTAGQMAAATHASPVPGPSWEQHARCGPISPLLRMMGGAQRLQGHWPAGCPAHMPLSQVGGVVLRSCSDWLPRGPYPYAGFACPGLFGGPFGLSGTTLGALIPWWVDPWAWTPTAPFFCTSAHRLQRCRWGGAVRPTAMPWHSSHASNTLAMQIGAMFLPGTLWFLQKIAWGATSARSSAPCRHPPPWQRSATGLLTAWASPPLAPLAG